MPSLGAATHGPGEALKDVGPRAKKYPQEQERADIIVADDALEHGGLVLLCLGAHVVQLQQRRLGPRVVDKRVVAQGEGAWRVCRCSLAKRLYRPLVSSSIAMG